MAAKLSIAPEATLDLDEAYGWYECQRTGLGEEFLGCVDACVQAICRMPELHAKVYAGFRRALVRRFPYAIFYECTDGTVTVYGIFHTARDPAKWRSATTVASPGASASLSPHRRQPDNLRRGSCGRIFTTWLLTVLKRRRHDTSGDAIGRVCPLRSVRLRRPRFCHKMAFLHPSRFDAAGHMPASPRRQ